MHFIFAQKHADCTTSLGQPTRQKLLPETQVGLLRLLGVLLPVSEILPAKIRPRNICTWQKRQEMIINFKIKRMIPHCYQSGTPSEQAHIE